MISKFRSAARGFSFYPSWSIPIALLALTLLSYGVRALSLGFYWDDWPYLWFFHRLGPQGIVDAFSGDRPFLSVIYITTLTVLGHSAQAWQVFALFAHWLFNLSFWLVLAAAWPQHTQKTVWAAFLFAVYPGFTGHWIVVIFGQAYLLFSFVFFSISLTLWLAQRKQSLPWQIGGTLLALVLSAFTMFSTEYFFGVELLRPVLLWLIFFNVAAIHQEKLLARAGNAVVRAVKWWAPYLVLMLSFVIWRGFIHQMEGYPLATLSGMQETPFDEMRGLLLTILGDLIESSLLAWGQTVQFSTAFLSSPTLVLRWLVVVLVTTVLVAYYLLRLCPDKETTEPERVRTQFKTFSWSVQAIVVGLVALLVSGLPFWITGLPLRMGFPQDRFSIMLSIGICLIMAGLINSLARDVTRKAGLVALAVALAVGFHFNTTDAYQEDSKIVRDFFWQLTWRAPDVKENTLFVTVNMPFRYFEDDSLSAPLNWTYDPAGQSNEMKYLLYDLLVRNSTYSTLATSTKIEKDFRATSFRGAASDLVAFTYAPPGCVHILDPQYDSDNNLLPEQLLRIINLSNPKAVLIDSSTAAVPPEDLFGKEPKHRWCYYYLKAELARQQEDWKAIYRLENKSIGEGIRPADPYEYLPFIEAHLRLFLWDDAYQLTQSAYQESYSLRPALCAAWRRSIPDQATATIGSPNALANAQALLNCSIP